MCEAMKFVDRGLKESQQTHNIIQKGWNNYPPFSNGWNVSKECCKKRSNCCVVILMFWRKCLKYFCGSLGVKYEANLARKLECHTYVL